MIDALIAGKLHGAPMRRTSKNGNPFTTCKVRVPTGEDSVFCMVICFEQQAQAALLALGDGEAVALAGSLKVGVWQAQDGSTRPSLDLTASQVLTSYHVTRKRRAMQPDQAGEQPQPRGPYRRNSRAADPGESGAGIPF